MSWNELIFDLIFVLGCWAMYIGAWLALFAVLMSPLILLALFVRKLIRRNNGSSQSKRRT